MIDWTSITNINLSLTMPPGRLQPSLREIKESVARRAGVPLEMLSDPCRQRIYAVPRQIAMYLCRELTDASYPKIAMNFGNRDHTTCLFAYRKVKKLEQTKAEYAQLIGDLRTEIMMRVNARNGGNFDLVLEAA